MKKQIIYLAAAMLSLAVIAGCSEKDDADSVTDPDTETVQDSNADSTTESDDGLTVYNTKYCELKYPDMYSDKVKVSVDDGDTYTVSFAMSDGTPVFDLLFGGKEGYVLGTLTGEDENTVIRIKDYDMDKSDSRYDDFCAMVEDVNIIIENLVKDNSFAVGEEIVKEDNSVFEIETRLVTMLYPEKWKDKVNIEVSDDFVKFTAEGTKLFDLLFGSDEGYLLGTYNGVSISIVSYDIDKSEFDDEMYYELCVMQEDVNVILQELMKDEAFKLAD